MHAFLTLTEPGRLVAPGLAAVERHLQTIVAVLPGAAGTAADGMLRRGKRLRPLVLLLCAEACGGHNHNSTRLAAAAELVHMASVVHDDVIDGASWRRGAPTAPRQLGDRLAVLLGDMLVASAWQEALDSGVPGATSALSEALTQMVAAEVAETMAAGHPVTEGQYLQTIEGKTAALFEAAARMGACSAGASPAQVERLAEYGHHLGMGFQMGDDLLDLFGDPLALGKDTGRDLIAGVYTLPVIHACQAEGGQALRASLRAVREAHKHNGEVAEVVRLVRSLGGEDYARARVEQSTAQARDALQALPPSEAREALADLTGLLVGRRV